MLEDFRTHLQQELRIPDILGDRCVHAHIEQASCRACVERCPTHAWQLDDDSLKINIEACDGCGLCAPACPQGAILHSHEPFLRQLDDQHLVAFVACEKTQLPSESGVIPCLHALSLHDLLKLYRQRVRSLIISSGHCNECPRHSVTPLQATLLTLNKSLTNRGYPSLFFQELTVDAWQQQRSLFKEPIPTEPVSRRNFFRRGFQTAIKEGLKIQGLLPQDKEHFPPPGTLLPTPIGTTPVALPYVPQIHSTLCNGCDTCFKICPQEALLLDVDNPAYVLVPDKCTGCRLCIDVCTQQAITLTQWTVPTTTRIPLQSTRCQRCGVPFQRPVDYPATQTLCHICNKVNHQKNLFQVMKD